jgi:hypothetical protein
MVLLLNLLVGFASEYGVREWISRRRRAAAREEFHAHLEREQLQQRLVTIDTLSPGPSLPKDTPERDRRR